jgi:hypothetical protein
VRGLGLEVVPVVAGPGGDADDGIGADLKVNRIHRAIAALDGHRRPSFEVCSVNYVACARGDLSGAN